MFLDLGMHRGPLLAYLMADPELSLQSILILTTIPRPAEDLDLRRAGALFSAIAAWPTARGSTAPAVVDRGAGGRVPGRAVDGTVAGQRAAGPQPRLSRHSGSGEESTC